MAVRKLVSLLVVAVVVAAIAFPCANAFDARTGGRKLISFAAGQANGKYFIKTDQPASIVLTNLMAPGNEFTAHCYSSQRNVPATIVTPSAPFTITFAEDLTANIPWVCNFSWIGTAETATLPVWTHNGTPYLSDCDDCLWQVKNDGFYIFSTAEGIYVNVHNWS